MLSWSLPHDVGPLGLQHADDLEGNVLDADGLAQRIGGLEEFFHDGAAHHADLGRRGDVAIGEEAAAADLPVAD